MDDANTKNYNTIAAMRTVYHKGAKHLISLSML